jgi:hypothetical protein
MLAALFALGMVDLLTVKASVQCYDALFKLLE